MPSTPLFRARRREVDANRVPPVRITFYFAQLAPESPLMPLPSSVSAPLRIVAFGEILWDLLPTGKKLGGAPVNFLYHSQTFAL